MGTLDRLDKALEFYEQENERKKNTALGILHEVVESTATITDDAKRIRAILTHRRECSPFALTNKLELVYEWGKMENVLHDESFWKFVNPNPDEQRYAEHRMNFIIEMLLRCEKDANGDFVDVSTQLQQNLRVRAEEVERRAGANSRPSFVMPAFGIAGYYFCRQEQTAIIQAV